MGSKTKAEWARLDAVAQAELVKRGEATPRELLEACEERLSLLDPLLNAVPVRDGERARKRAESADLATTPFAGVPFLVKEITPWPGLRWSFGARFFRQNTAPMGTPWSGAVERAGLVTLGKTNSSEFGLLGSTEGLLDGVTHNPWDLSLSAAGSSGGAAAAVASGLVPVAHASDGGGSIRVPASVNGLFGFMPSRGRIHSAALGQSDYGALVLEHCVSRTVRDSALLFALAEDPQSGLPPAGHVTGPSSKRLRIGAWTQTLMGERPDGEIERLFEQTVELLRGLGHEVVPLDAPPVDGPKMRDGFFRVAAAAVAGAVEMVTRMTGAPPPRDGLEPFTWELAERFRREPSDAMEKTRALFAENAARYLTAFERCDVVLTPTLATLPWRLGHFSPLLPADLLIARTARAVSYTPIHNVAGCPAMSVPLCWWQPEAGDASAEPVPVGMHFAAAPGEDARLLALAYELERAQPWAHRWPRHSIPRLVG